MAAKWQYCTLHSSICKIIEEQSLWGEEVCRVWLPNQDAVVSVPKSTLQPLSADLQIEIEAQRVTYIAAAAKVAEVLEGASNGSEDLVLLAPMESNVTPLPHQIQALSRAVTSDRVRYMLADEVGLGKTIEAGLIIRELKLRGLVRRTLIVVPKGIATQWVAEMRTHFNENFQLILGEDIAFLQRMQLGNHSTYWADPTGLNKINISQARNPWQVFDQVIVSLDSVKPLEKRRGWSQERVDAFNRSRYEDLITADWDLVIVDEAHRLGGSTDQVARYKLGKGLAEAAPYMLLLSATPHQGKTDAFHRLMNLLDDNAFPDLESVSRDRVTPYVIRTEKRKAIDADGKPLFKPRRTQMVAVTWESRHYLQQQLYEAVTAYVREGYNEAICEKKHHLGFLMILMQRLVVSSTQAIRTTLERRLTVLTEQTWQANLRLSSTEEEEPEFNELFYDMNAQELLDELLKSHLTALQNEREHVEFLLGLSIHCGQVGADAKAETLIEWIYQLQVEENESDLKILIFTEFVPTQEMLKEFLETRGISVVTLNGSLSMEERKQAQESFRNTHRVLISTDAGGEGLNLQFAHVIINYDIPWNPMRLEQRIGRVDRIGQTKVVRAINFIFENSVEFRVREVLEQKLTVILNEFGIDKTGDVLDSAQAEELFDDVFTSAILNPEELETFVDHTVSQIRDEILQTQEVSSFYDLSEEPDRDSAERLRTHPLPHWVERMTVAYLNVSGGKAKRKRSAWELTWPDGYIEKRVVFNTQEADRLSNVELINLENARVRRLALNLPMIAKGQPLLCLTLTGLPTTISGFWGLFEIRLQSAGSHQKNQFLRIPNLRRKYVSVFLDEEGQLFLPTARHIWDTLQTEEIKTKTLLGVKESVEAYNYLLTTVEQAGQEPFRVLQELHLKAIEREKERGMVAFNSRRKAIERIGLPEVRQFRLFRLEEDELDWRNELKLAQQTIPDIKPLLMFRVMQGSG